MPTMQAGTSFTPPISLAQRSQSGVTVECPTAIIAANGTNHNWLPWIPGCVSVTAFSENALLTGRMSGCFIVVFRDNRPEKGTYRLPCVAHIGTVDEPDTEGSLEAKAAWNAFVRTLAIRDAILFSFCPTSDANTPPSALASAFQGVATMAAGSPKFYAAVEKTAGGFKGYTLFCRLNAPTVNVVGVREAQPAPIPF